jgi:glutathione S-transferase
VVGKGVTYADLVLFNELSELRRREGVEAVVKTFPELIQHSDRVAARPNIAQWLAKRPQTEW